MRFFLTASGKNKSNGGNPEGAKPKRRPCGFLARRGQGRALVAFPCAWCAVPTIARTFASLARGVMSQTAPRPQHAVPCPSHAHNKYHADASVGEQQSQSEARTAF